MAAPTPKANQSSQYALSSESSKTAAFPSSPADGDLMILHAIIQGGFSRSIATPSGWNVIHSTSGINSLYGASFWRVYDSSQGSSVTVSINGGAMTGSMNMAIASYTGYDSTTPINVSGVSGSSNSANCTAPTITTTVNDCLLLHFGFCGSQRTSTAPSGYTELFDYDHSGGGQGTGNAVHTKEQASAGASGAATATWSSGAWNNAAHIAIAPGSGGTGGGFQAAWARNSNILIQGAL